MLLRSRASARSGHGTPSAGNVSVSAPPSPHPPRRFGLGLKALLGRAPQGEVESAGPVDETAGTLAASLKYVAAIAFLVLAVTGVHLLSNPGRSGTSATSPKAGDSSGRPSDQSLQLNLRLDQLSARLDQLSLRLDSLAAPAASFPSASAIAAEIAKQTPKEPAPVSRPTLTFELKASSIVDAKLQFAVFVLTRRGTPATDFTLKSPSGISGWLECLQTGPESDRYQLSFQPQKGAMPASWTFSISYLTRDRKTETRTFQAHFDPKEQPPAHLRIVEKLD